jgi:predicted ATPase/serine/threonine protein kinase
MTPEQYRRVGQLFHAALELTPDGRMAFLADVCGGDEALRQEVESLLTAHDKAGEFIAMPAENVAAHSVDHDQEARPLSGRIGAYEVLSVIGRGGMGEVYLAQDTRLARRVAVKLLRSGLTSHPDAARRFEQEARAASSLNHPNIVTIYEIGDIDERRFLAMEFVEGRSLAAMIGRPVSFGELARIGAQLAKALSVAHAAGIVHRDIKPENIMVREDGYVKLLDFGVARLVSAPTITSTTDEMPGVARRVILGTPRYMSPEQARGEMATTASDVFSLGVVLYELVTGTHPFESASKLDTFRANTTAETPNPAQQSPNMPARLRRLLVKMLESHESARPRASDVEVELTQLAAALSEPSQLSALSGRIGPPPEHNLPPQHTLFIGRAAELAAVKGLLLDPGVRLMTLTGPGGTGKTRLAMQVAADLALFFEGGVSFVNLAPLTDPGLVASAVARAVGVRETADQPLMTTLCEHLRSRGRTLLLMDNFEQVSDAAAIVRELLDVCPELTALVTSRLVLHIYGEREFPVPPLPLPDAQAASSPATLMECPSIALFVQRAVAVRPDFSLTSRNAEMVVEICRRLDGLPLAIELAGARVKILPPAELLARIERRLELLTGGARDRPERQQTLRRAIKWSYDLLSPAEQRLFRRLSVFAGGCTLEAAEAVCDTCEDLGVDILDGITSLVDNSLLVQRVADDAVPRFVMLETFREYAREALRESGDAAGTQRAHAAYLLVLAEEVPLESMPPDREPWLRSCDAEHDNFRAAINHLVVTGEVEWALRMGAALFRFWEQRDHFTEGCETLKRILTMPGAQVPTRLRARALYGASVLNDIQGDVDSAERFSHEACRIYRQFGDTHGVAATMVAMAWQAQRQGRLAEATSLHAETVALWQELGDSTLVELARSNMANAAKEERNFDLARGLLQDVLGSSHARGDLRGVASTLNNLGDLAAAESDYDGAREFHQQSLATFRQLDDRWGVARVLTDLAHVDLQARDYAAADRSLAEALGALDAIDHKRGVARQLELLAYCAGLQSRDGEAVRLASAAAAIRLRLGAPAKRLEHEKVNDTLARARTRIGADAYNEAWREGRTTSLERILGMAARSRA